MKKYEKIFFGLIGSSLFVITGLFFILNPNKPIDSPQGFIQLNTLSRFFAWLMIHLGFLSFKACFDIKTSKSLSKLLLDFSFLGGGIIFLSSSLYSLITRVSWGSRLPMYIHDSFMYYMEGVYFVLSIILLIFYLKKRASIFQLLIDD